LETLPIPERGGASVSKAEETVGALVPANGPPLALTAADMIIGRSDPQRGFHPDVDLLTFDPAQTVSRRHARLTRRAGHFYIEDLNAFNRTRVNGTPLVPHQDVEIHSGDVMRLGHVELRFEIRPR
jgi:serine/threonine-protein kinase